MDSVVDDNDYVGLYIALKPEELVDLEVAAAAAIAWCRTLKAASQTMDSGYEYRVQLVEARPGSSKWLARIERSKINQVAEDMKTTWERLPAVIKIVAGLAVGLAVTGKPTWDYYLGDDGFTPKQLEQMQEMMTRTNQSPAVQAHRKEVFREVLRDPNITGLGSGIVRDNEWRSTPLIPANQFAEAEGLFALHDPDDGPTKRTLYQTLDVILVTPRLENAELVWTFRQEGLPGKFSALMKDTKFLAALESNKIEERLRLNIPMRIRLEIKETLINGQWRVQRKGRSILEVLSPAPD